MSVRQYWIITRGSPMAQESVNSRKIAPKVLIQRTSILPFPTISCHDLSSLSFYPLIHFPIFLMVSNQFRYTQI